MRKTNKTACAVTGDKMKFEGKLTLPVTLNGTTKKVSFRPQTVRKSIWNGLDGTFQTILGGLDFACAYLDDIGIASKSTKEHRRQINEVFERIHNFGFKIKETKCEFLMNEIRYFGHI